MKKLSSLLIIAGVVTILISLFIFILTFYPVLSAEANYKLNQIQPPTKNLEPKDTDFGIVVPKIFANAKIIANVNPFDQKEYQIALTKGVAHAAGTSFPGQLGNVFLFSHSSVNFYEANRYNSIFYLLSKLEKEDEIDLYYKGQKFVYKVIDKKIVGAEAVSYLSGKAEKKALTLMTCWPPGTTLKRLLIIGEIVI